MEKLLVLSVLSHALSLHLQTKESRQNSQKLQDIDG